MPLLLTKNDVVRVLDMRNCITFRLTGQLK